MAREREGKRGRSHTAKGRGKAGNIGILLQRYVNLRLADDPVLRHYGCQWRGVVAGGVCHPQKDIGRQEETAGWFKNIYVTIINRA